MNMRRTLGIFALIAFAGVAMAAPITVPARAASNKSLVVSDADKKLGTVYYSVKTPPERSVKFSSEAVNEKIDGIATDIVGYAIAGPAENPAKFAAGAWRLAVKSIDTKIAERNGHLQGKQWFNAAANPDITFALKEVSDVKLTKELQGGPKTYTGTYKGEMTINGQTKEIEIPNVTMTFVAASPQTAQSYKGDLISIRCKYEVKLSDYGITNDVITTSKKVSDTIKIDQFLMVSTVPAEEQPELVSKPVDPAAGAPKGADPKTAAPKTAEPKKEAAPKEAPKPKPVGG